MSRLDMILFMVLPMLESVAAMLEVRDANSTGNDDRAAQIIRSAVAALKEFQRRPNG